MDGIVCIMRVLKEAIDRCNGGARCFPLSRQSVRQYWKAVVHSKEAKWINVLVRCAHRGSCVRRLKVCTVFAHGVQVSRVDGSYGRCRVTLEILKTSSVFRASPCFEKKQHQSVENCSIA